MGLSLRSDRLATLYLAHPLKRILRDTGGKAVPILMYHSISELPERTCHPYYETRTSPRVFEEHMKFLFENGYSAVDLSELPAVMGNGKGPSRSVVITFDDGYRDFLNHAFPILERYGLKATVFLVTGMMGTSSDMFGGKDILTWGEAGELRKRGVVFGSHTVNHLKLKYLQLKAMEAEIADSKKEIESRLGEPVEVFSCPYAFPEGKSDFLEEYFGTLERCGYRAGVTTVIGRVRKRDNLLALKRLPVNEYDDAVLFKAKLEGAYDWVHVPQYLRKKCFGWIGE
jgi:peptidoglycan/xylan/chitin deacetylase (PgdA/CDA1 family)